MNGNEAFERLILVDRNDSPIGEGGKLDVHVRGLRHRAFSIFIWNSAGKLLLQKRAGGKYHSAGLWANSCCGHPRVGEAVSDAAHRRLREELGMSADLYPHGTYNYRARLSNALIENEFVHLFGGCSDGLPELNPKEVDDVKWVEPQTLFAELHSEPERYAIWFRRYLEQIPDRILLTRSS